MPPRGRPTLVVLSLVTSSSVASFSSASSCGASVRRGLPGKRFSFWLSPRASERRAGSGRCAQPAPLSRLLFPPGAESIRLTTIRRSRRAPQAAERAASTGCDVPSARSSRAGRLPSHPSARTAAGLAGPPTIHHSAIGGRRCRHALGPHPGPAVALPRSTNGRRRCDLSLGSSTDRS